MVRYKLKDIKLISIICPDEKCKGNFEQKIIATQEEINRLFKEGDITIKCPYCRAEIKISKQKVLSTKIKMNTKMKHITRNILCINNYRKVKLFNENNIKVPKKVYIKIKKDARKSERILGRVYLNKNEMIDKDLFLNEYINSNIESIEKVYQRVLVDKGRNKKTIPKYRFKERDGDETLPPIDE